VKTFSIRSVFERIGYPIFKLREPNNSRNNIKKRVYSTFLNHVYQIIFFQHPAYPTKIMNDVVNTTVWKQQQQKKNSYFTLLYFTFYFIVRRIWNFSCI